MVNNALIIGGTGGIGRAITASLTGQGIMVYATYCHENKFSEKENCRFLKLDITQTDDIDKTIGYFEFNNIKIDLIINCATSRLKLKPFTMLSAEEIKEDIDAILMGAVNFYQKIIPLLKRNRSGIIINIISCAIFNPIPSRMSSYIIAKSGLLGLTKSLSVELAPANIKVYGLSPNFVETDLIKAFPEKLLELEREKMPEKKFLQPEDIARAIDMIVENNIISGTNIKLYSKNDLDKII